MIASSRDRIVAGDATAERVRLGNGPNWLLIPGGAGMGCNYLVELFERLNIDGSVWSFDLFDPKKGGRSDADVIDSWRQSLREIVTQLGPCVLVGHSFGGMLALSTVGIESHLAALVLMDTSPDRGWEAAVADTAKTIQCPDEKPCEKAFEADPSELTLNRLFVAWAPYYFTSEFEEVGKDLLRRNSYQHEVYRIGQRGFCPGYETRLNLSGIPTYCLAGERDVVTPLTLFAQSSVWNGGGVQYDSIARGGHFPWIENFDQVAAVLGRVNTEIGRRKV